VSREREGLVRSVQVRLARHAKEIGVDPNLVLTRFALERFLYRLSCSPHGDRFVLKGALLMLAWLGDALRPTRDADVLGFGDLSDGSLQRLFAEICTTAVEPDAMSYDPATIAVADIRPEDAYGGKRVTLRASLGPARLRVQVDVGIGDAVVPGPEWLDYPSLLGLPSPRLRSYPPEVVVAEKVHAMVVLGSRNSRMRDFFDVHALSCGRSFEGERLCRALRATFERRQTSIPEGLPLALTSEFAELDGKRVQWAAFLGKNRIAASVPDLGQVVHVLASFLEAPLRAARAGSDFDRRWPAGGPWQVL
jgi:hypothetical protein